jgi:hypothetical protein
VPRHKISEEDYHLIAVFDWLRLNKLTHIAWHTANERRISLAGGTLLKRKGVLAGVSDIALMRAKKGFNGLWLELKIKPNKPTLTQLKFIKNMRAEGYKAEVVWSCDEAIKVIQDYLS